MRKFGAVAEKLSSLGEKMTAARLYNLLLSDELFKHLQEQYNERRDTRVWIFDYLLRDDLLQLRTVSARARTRPPAAAAPAARPSNGAGARAAPRRPAHMKTTR